jgi:hypothetical protein
MGATIGCGYGFGVDHVGPPRATQPAKRRMAPEFSRAQVEELVAGGEAATAGGRTGAATSCVASQRWLPGCCSDCGPCLPR